MSKAAQFLALSRPTPPTAPRRRDRLGTLAAALALAACGQQSTPNPTPPANAPTALVHGPVSSPVFDRLKTAMRMVQHTGTQKAADHDMLILDGDAHTPAALKGDALVAEAVRSGKWVLGVDLGEAHKKEGLGAYVRASTCGSSPAYAARTGLDARGRFEAWVVEFPVEAPAPPSGRPSGPSARREPPGPGTRSCEAGANLAAPSHGERAEGSAAPAFAATLLKTMAASRRVTAQDALPPAGLIYATYHFTESHSRWSWPTFYRHQVGTEPDGTPIVDDSTQLPTYSTNYTVVVYLDNAGNPQGNRQVVLVQSDATANPDGGYGNANMNFRGSGNWVGGTYDEMGWFQDSLFIYNSAPAAWTRVAAGPPTLSGQTSLSTGVTFSVGYNSLAGPAGSFDYNSDSQSRDITDWKVNSAASDQGQAVGWYYRTAYPYDADQDYGGSCTPNQQFYAVPSCFIGKSPNNLSLTSLGAYTEAVWRTPAVLTGTQDLHFRTAQTISDVACTIPAGLFCYQAQGFTLLNAGDGLPVSVDLGVVVPIAVSSITFSSNPVTPGSGAATVTATLTLASPAKVDTTVLLSSSGPNAVVPQSVVVPQGQTSAAFPMQTNASGIAPGGNVTASISAFYGQISQPFALTIKN